MQKMRMSIYKNPPAFGHPLLKGERAQFPLLKGVPRNEAGDFFVILHALCGKKNNYE
jgi:hypothetical protein